MTGPSITYQTTCTRIIITPFSELPRQSKIHFKKSTIEFLLRMRNKSFKTIIDTTTEY